MPIRRFATPVFGVLALLFCASTARAQFDCAEYFEYQEVKCVYQDCVDHALIPIPRGGELYHYTCTPYNCCNQLITECDFDGNSCPGVWRNNPDVRRHVVEVAATSRVLVADCRGR